MKDNSDNTNINQNEKEKKTDKNTNINELNKTNLVLIETELNEFYAKTNVIQYYLNNLDKPIDLIIKFPNNSKIQFSKFTLEMNNKKVISKVIDKIKAEEKYTDAIASGNTGAFSSKELNEIKVNIGNIPGKSIVKLTSEFIQFLNIEDMSYCYSFMKNFPNFSSQNYNNAKLQKIKVKINIKTFSKITRLITKGFENNLEKKFNEKSNIIKQLEYENYRLQMRYNYIKDNNQKIYLNNQNLKMKINDYENLCKKYKNNNKLKLNSTRNKKNYSNTYNNPNSINYSKNISKKYIYLK
jgi:hypothetical protein